MHYVSVCAIFRNEATYLEEWLDFHVAQGIGHFYLYDNMSTDNPAQVLNNYKKRGLVTQITCEIPYNKGAQRSSYTHCLKHFGHTSRWIAFIDLDEFLFSPQGKLSDKLVRYETHPGVVVHWQCYGSAGHQQTPPGAVTANFLYRAPTDWVRNLRVKSIVNPSRTVGPSSPHFFDYQDDMLAVNEQHQEVSVVSGDAKSRPKTPDEVDISVDPFARKRIKNLNVSANLFRINHYSIKSRDEYLAKRAKQPDGDRKYDDHFFAYHDRNEIYDPILKDTLVNIRS